METLQPIQLRVLGCSGGVAPGRGSTCFLLDRQVAVDAGCLASALSLEDQRLVRDVLVTHPHLDHLRDLALFLDNTHGQATEPATIHAPPPVLDALLAHYFNGVLWPELSTISPPPARMREVLPEQTIRLRELEVTPFTSYHGSPAVGYILRRQRSDAGDSVPGPSLAIATDTGYHEPLFEQLAALPDLAALVIEASFPNRLRDVATSSHHLTPDLLERGLRIIKKRHPECEVLVTHLKPAYREEICHELAALPLTVEILQDGDQHEIP